jgi:xanthine dehydrogenase accessory factor
MGLWIVLRGGGDLASGVAIRLHRAGLKVLVTELPQPMVVRRLVAFAEAVYAGQAVVEGVLARRVEGLPQAMAVARQEEIPVIVDPQAEILAALRRALPVSTPLVVVDARMTKRPSANELPPEVSPGERGFKLDAAGTAPVLLVGLGPGFVAGENCHVAIETNRGHCLGRVLWQGAPEADTGIPESVIDHRAERVLRSPSDGVLQAHAAIGDHVEAGQVVAQVAGQPVVAAFKGVLRGLIHPGLQVTRGLKIGDIDPRDDPRFCRMVSDKSMAVGGGILEAILSLPELRPHLWD